MADKEKTDIKDDAKQVAKSMIKDYVLICLSPIHWFLAAIKPYKPKNFSWAWGVGGTIFLHVWAVIAIVGLLFFVIYAFAADDEGVQTADVNSAASISAIKNNNEDPSSTDSSPSDSDGGPGDEDSDGQTGAGQGSKS